jgi:hypothetical protein
MGANNGTVNLKGKTYFTVARRVADFRAACPIAEGWGLVTKVVELTERSILFRAAVVDPQGREVAVGYAEEVRSNRGVNSTSALENAETSAIGRALAAAGYGGDGAYASADELVNALKQQDKRFKRAAPPSAPPKSRMEAIKATGARLGVLQSWLAEQHETTVEDLADTDFYRLRLDLVNRAAHLPRDLFAPQGAA